MSNKNNTTLYVGVTNDLIRRVIEHKSNIHEGFSSKYNLHKLVYFEIFDDEISAIEAEKYLKKCYRKTKEKFINQMNPQWNDLFEDMVEN